jgi:hypothetical protein
MKDVGRLVALLVAGALAVGAYFGFAFGDCHDGAGLCGGGRSSANVGAYAVGVTLAVLAGVLVATAVTSRPRARALAALGTAVAAVLVAVVLEGVPIDVLSDRLGTTRGALYKTIHDARRRLRAALAAGGHRIDGGEGGEDR